MAVVTFEVKCETCGESLGGGYAAEEGSILEASRDHAKEHADAQEGED